MIKTFTLLPFTALVLASVALAQVPAEFNVTNIAVLQRSKIVEGSVKMKQAVNMKDRWYCETPCFAVFIEFKVDQPQSNYKFISLAEVGPRDEGGRIYSYEVMSAKLNIPGKDNSQLEQNVVRLPEGILPDLPTANKITLNGKKYKFTLAKDKTLKMEAAE